MFLNRNCLFWVLSICENLHYLLSWMHSELICPKGILLTQFFPLWHRIDSPELVPPFPQKQESVKNIIEKHKYFLSWWVRPNPEGRKNKKPVMLKNWPWGQTVRPKISIRQIYQIHYNIAINFTYSRQCSNLLLFGTTRLGQ